MGSEVPQVKLSRRYQRSTDSLSGSVCPGIVLAKLTEAVDSFINVVHLVKSDPLLYSQAVQGRKDG